MSDTACAGCLVTTLEPTAVSGYASYRVHCRGCADAAALREQLATLEARTMELASEATALAVRAEDAERDRDGWMAREAMMALVTATNWRPVSPPPKPSPSRTGPRGTSYGGCWSGRYRNFAAFEPSPWNALSQPTAWRES